MLCKVTDFGLSRELAEEDEAQAEYTTQVNFDFLKIDNDVTLRASNVTQLCQCDSQDHVFPISQSYLLLSDACHPMKQALFHAHSCLLSVQVKDLLRIQT